MSLVLDFCYQRHDFALEVKADIPLTGVTGIFGASGCGKTSLLRCIAGLEELSNGEIIFKERVWTRCSNVTQPADKPVNLAVERRGIGFVFQQANLFPHLNVAQNLEYGLKRKPDSEKLFGFDGVVELLGLAALLQRESSALSGGESQRVAIARAILSQPTLLLMDEPLASLDQQSKLEILPYLEKLPTELGLPILYVSHSVDEISRLVDELIVLKRTGNCSKVLKQGAVSELLPDINWPTKQVGQIFNVLDCVVKAVDSQYHLASLDCDGLVFKFPCENIALGKKVRVSIQAKDISLCLSLPKDSSILNILPAKVTHIKRCNFGQCLVKLTVGQSHLLANISAYSCQQLLLSPGLKLYVQIKAMALIKP